MSRHQVPGLYYKHKIFVGWNQELQTFFVQAIDKNKEYLGFHKSSVLYKGLVFREIEHIKDLQEELKPFASLHNLMIHRLEKDKDEGA